MTHYEQHIRTRLEADPEYQALARKIDEAERRYEELRIQRANFVTRFVVERSYPSAED